MHGAGPAHYKMAGRGYAPRRHSSGTPTRSSRFSDWPGSAPPHTVVPHCQPGHSTRRIAGSARNHRLYVMSAHVGRCQPVPPFPSRRACISIGSTPPSTAAPWGPARRHASSTPCPAGQEVGECSREAVAGAVVAGHVGRGGRRVDDGLAAGANHPDRAQAVGHHQRAAGAGVVGVEGSVLAGVGGAAEDPASRATLAAASASESAPGGGDEDAGGAGGHQATGVGPGEVDSVAVTERIGREDRSPRAGAGRR